MKYLVLFDIDGTILRMKRGLARELFGDLMNDVFGQEIPRELIPKFSGMTDMNILRLISEAAGISFEETKLRLPEIWIKMHGNFAAHINSENINMMPGAGDLIRELAADPQVRLGLVTGNIMDNAYLKLRVHGLDTFFPVGAFGSDKEDRNELPLLAIQRANELWHGEEFTSQNTIIIGDTHRDVECAKSNGIKVLAVATGEFKKHELDELNPDISLEDLSNVPNVKKLIFECLNHVHKVV